MIATRSLLELAQSDDFDDRWYAVNHEDVTPTLLTVLGNNGNPILNRAVAGNPRTPLPTLREIARLNDDQTLLVLSENPVWVDAVLGFAEEEGFDPTETSWGWLETEYLRTHP